MPKRLRRTLFELAHRREVRALKQSWPGLHRQILLGDVRSGLDNWTEHANAAGLSQGKIDELGRDFVLLWKKDTGEPSRIELQTIAAKQQRESRSRTSGCRSACRTQELA